MNVRTPIPSRNKMKMPQKWGEKRNKTTKNKENAIERYKYYEKLDEEYHSKKEQ